MIHAVSHCETSASLTMLFSFVLFVPLSGARRIQVLKLSVTNSTSVPLRSLWSLIDRYLSAKGILRYGSSTRRYDGQLVYVDYFLLETLISLERSPGAFKQLGGNICK